MNLGQYGFCRGKSRVDAIDRVVNFVKNARLQKVYSTIILINLVDIRDTFDNAWWPKIIVQVHGKGLLQK